MTYNTIMFNREKLIKKRKELNLSHSDLSFIIGSQLGINIPLNTLRTYERSCEPTFTRGVAICQALGLDIKDLISYESGKEVMPMKQK